MNKTSFCKRVQAGAISVLLSICLIHNMSAQNSASTNAVPTLPSAAWPVYKQAIEGMNVPITFYGRVIDQNGKVLPGAQVVLRVQRPHFDPRYIATAEYVHIERTTDEAGLFSLNDMTGKSLEILSVTSPGYDIEPNMIHVYGPTNGTSDKPVIFKMWRKDIKEQLIKGERSFKTVPDGTPYFIDLTNGTISLQQDQTCDLRVYVKMLQKIDQRNYAWSCEIRPINGALVEEKDSSSPMYLAPAEGYANTFNMTVDATNKWNRSSGKLRFFVRLKGGAEYGWFSIDLANYHRTGGQMRIEYAINPSGSRILR